MIDVLVLEALVDRNEERRKRLQAALPAIKELIDELFQEDQLKP